MRNYALEWGGLAGQTAIRLITALCPRPSPAARQVVYRAEPANDSYSLAHLEAWLLSPVNADADADSDGTVVGPCMAYSARRPPFRGVPRRLLPPSQPCDLPLVPSHGPTQPE